MTPDLIAGRYQVLRPVGRGGLGTVGLCRDEVLGRAVALCARASPIGRRLWELPAGLLDLGGEPPHITAARCRGAGTPRT